MFNEQVIKVALLGDISLNADLSWREPGSWKLFTDEIEEYLAQTDIVLFNLESPVIGSGKENQLKYPRLKTTEKALDNLKFSGQTVAILANNHAYDCLIDGHMNTVRALSDRGFSSLGAGISKETASKPIIFEKNGIHIGILAYVSFSTNPCIPDGANFCLNELRKENVIRDILELKKKVDFCIVYCHWGIDYFDFPTPGQIDLGRAMVDAGANIVFGSHSHVIQGWSQYRDGFIFYSLGNTCFGRKIFLLNGRKNRRSISAFLHFTLNRNCCLDKLCFMSRSVDGLTVSRVESKEREFLQYLSKPLSIELKDYWFFFKIRMCFYQFVLKPYRYFFGENRNFLKQLRGIRLWHIKRYTRTWN